MLNFGRVWGGFSPILKNPHTSKMADRKASSNRRVNMKEIFETQLPLDVDGRNPANQLKKRIYIYMYIHILYIILLYHIKSYYMISNYIIHTPLVNNVFSNHINSFVSQSADFCCAWAPWIHEIFCGHVPSRTYDPWSERRVPRQWSWWWLPRWWLQPSWKI